MNPSDRIVSKAAHRPLAGQSRGPGSPSRLPFGSLREALTAIPARAERSAEQGDALLCFAGPIRFAGPWPNYL